MNFAVGFPYKGAKMSSQERINEILSLKRSDLRGHAKGCKLRIYDVNGNSPSILIQIALFKKMGLGKYIPRYLPSEEKKEVDEEVDEMMERLSISIENPYIEGIFQCCRKLSQDQEIGPVPKNTFNTFSLGSGAGKIPYSGYVGWNYTFWDPQLHLGTPKNNYTLLLDECNYESSVIDRCKDLQSHCYTTNVRRLYKQMYDHAMSTRHTLVHQAEFGRQLKIPATLKPDGTQKDRMIAELLSICEKSGLLKIIKNRHRYVKPGDITKIPKNVYTLDHSNGQSSGEASTRKILGDYPELRCLWQVALPELKNSPYDFALTNQEGNILGLIEVQGLQHTQRVRFFHPHESDFEHRQRLDRRKEEVAKDYDAMFLTVDVGTGKLPEKEEKEVRRFAQKCIRKMNSK